MRIGTWNVDAKGTPAHENLLAELDCHVWLLTEVPPTLSSDGWTSAVSSARMGPGQHFAAVWSRAAGTAVEAPNPATAALQVDGVRFFSSVLPWRSSGPEWTWREGGQADRTVDAVASLDRALGPASVWGGDWNQTMTGPNHGGTRVGRAAIDAVLTRHGLALPTRALAQPVPDMASIDHVAVPLTWAVTAVTHHRVPRRLSDHDAYVIDVEPSHQTGDQVGHNLGL